jgi:DNA-binding HxlR family transcriptional regulator
MRISECPVRTTADVIDGKWKPQIINSLKTGNMRFGRLRRSVPEATRKVITSQLRELEKDGIVLREVLALKPLQVQYSLTPYGRTLVPVLTEMAAWGKKHQRLTRTAKRVA